MTTTTKHLEVTMSKEEVKQDVAIKSRLQYITDEEQLKVIDFIMDYSFKDSKEVYTNGTVLVPLFRVLDAIEQKGNGYQTGVALSNETIGCNNE